MPSLETFRLDVLTHDALAATFTPPGEEYYRVACPQPVSFECEVVIQSAPFEEVEEEEEEAVNDAIAEP
jgi:hypothetical protein